MNKSLSLTTALSITTRSLTRLTLILSLALVQQSLAAPAGQRSLPSESKLPKNKETATKEPYEPDIHYLVLDQFPVSSEPTVTELFSIYCPGCYRWEKGALGTLKENLAKSRIEFKQAHMFFMGKYGKQATTALAMTQGTELYEPVKDALFKKIQVERKRDWKNDDDFFNTLSKAGLTRKAFEQQQSGPVALKNPIVLKREEDWNKYAGSIKTVPSFVVNNRYLIKTSSVKNFDEMDQLITWLAKLPAKASPTNPKASDGAPKSSAENVSPQKKGG